MIEHFTVAEARALQRDQAYVVHAIKDEHHRVLIPQRSLVEIIGIDVFPA